MTSTTKRVIACFLLLFGTTGIVFSDRIVFPWLAMVSSIESIVGKENVIHMPDGGVAFPNPGAMARWIASVALIGGLTYLGGVWLLIRASKKAGISN
jgi:hypothetical protein